MTSRTTPTITTTLTTTTYRATFSLDEVDGLDHVEAQLDAAVGVVGPGHRKSGHAVVAITQQLDPETVTHLKTTEKTMKKIRTVILSIGHPLMTSRIFQNYS